MLDKNWTCMRVSHFDSVSETFWFNASLLSSGMTKEGKQHLINTYYIVGIIFFNFLKTCTVTDLEMEAQRG